MGFEPGTFPSVLPPAPVSMEKGRTWKREKEVKHPSFPRTIKVRFVVNIIERIEGKYESVEFYETIVMHIKASHYQILGGAI